ncbi:hypothetical protein L211DRAFT_836274 [Terfezia boudieri ATCC MYA-4762]|uniref:DUF4219 domain-containing protein n=1 Tax=Terfezia boudieri ATCC MYA-4762 TaxID=1051890 RepID=A0A3N4LV40_9PEZI|nr:hypothetical protein L211DRAFT_836274 [Terfezia boudieri ATCC MYA-4762]
MSKERSIPKIEPKLSGQSNYAQWILSIEQTLSSYDYDDGSIWDIVTGNKENPDPGAKGKSANALAIQWKKDNNFAILTMKRNCKAEAVAAIGLAMTAKEAYDDLKSKYEGKTVTVTALSALMINVIKLAYDDTSTTIDDHISEFDKRWGYMRSTLAAGFSDDLKEFGKILGDLSKNEQAKGAFLLATLPSYYNTLVENIQLKTGLSYGDITINLKTYVPYRQKSRRGKAEGSTPENPVVLKPEAGQAKDKGDNGKRCHYCINKGWKGLNHTESECFTKRREKKKAKKEEAEECEDESGGEGITLKAIRLGRTRTNRLGHLKWDK